MTHSNVINKILFGSIRSVGRLADDYYPLIVPPICWDSANTFLERSHIYATLTEWHKLEGHIRNKKKLPI